VLFLFCFGNSFLRSIQGFVYHTINCFEDIDGCIIVDAFVSKLNAARESSQFELGDDPGSCKNKKKENQFDVEQYTTTRFVKKRRNKVNFLMFFLNRVIRGDSTLWLRETLPQLSSPRLGFAKIFDFV
jgi:hypothetical protein